MTFEEYIPLWNQKHPFARMYEDDRDEESDLETLTLQKLDWLAYCKKHDEERPHQAFFDGLFEELLQLIADESGNIGIAFGSFYTFFRLVSHEQAEVYDMKLLNYVNKLLRRASSSFEQKYQLFIAWARNRGDFLVEVQLGFPAPEAGWMPAFYCANRDEFMKIRSTDYPAMKVMANYFLFMYEACKTMDRYAMAGDIVKVHDFLLGFMRDVLASARFNGYYEDEEIIKRMIDDLKAETDQVPSVFISYCWSDTEIADRIEAEINGLAYVRRDTHEVETGDSLSAFMKTIRKQDYVVLVISDEYLRRRNCMYEVLQLLRDYEEGDNNFWGKVIPFVTATGIYEGTKKAEKIRYWTDSCDKLEAAISAVPSPATEALVKEAKVLRYISLEIGKLLEHISDELCDRDLDVFIENTKKKLEGWAQYGETPIKDALMVAMQALHQENDLTGIE